MIGPDVSSDAAAPSYGDERVRTADPLLARQVLSQLSYAPVLTSETLACQPHMGLPGIEPGTSRLSGVRSNQLSYRPARLSGRPDLHRTVCPILSTNEKRHS